MQSVSRLPTFCSQSAPYRPNTDRPEPSVSSSSPIREVDCSRVRLSSFMLNHLFPTDTLIIFSTRDHLSFRFIGIPYANPFARVSHSIPYTSHHQWTCLWAPLRPRQCRLGGLSLHAFPPRKHQEQETQARAFLYTRRRFYRRPGRRRNLRQRNHG